MLARIVAGLFLLEGALLMLLLARVWERRHVTILDEEEVNRLIAVYRKERS